MADKEIPDLTAATTPLSGAEEVHISQGGNSRRATLSDIAAIATGAMLKSEYDPDTNGIIAVAQGGTNAATASGARTNLGLGTMAVQGAGAVAITGGSVTGITDLTVADGGTGASDASTARTNLGLAIGSDVQAYSANLAGFAATTVANVQNRDNHHGTQLASTISDFSTAADLRIAAAVGVSVQAYDALLASVAALTVSAGDVIYATGADTVAALPAGASGQVLAIDGSGVPAWDTSLVVGGLIAANNLSDVANADTSLTNLGFGAAGKAIAADATEGDVRQYLNLGRFCADRAELRALDTTKDTRAFFDGDIWNWVGTSFATILRTLVGVSSAVDAGTDTITINAHGLETGVAILSNATLNGVTANTLVYAVVVDANNFKLASSYANAVAAVPTIMDLTGTAVMTIYRHNDPAEGVIVPKANIVGTTGAWTRDNYASREWQWRWWGIVGGLTTSGPDQAPAINAWMAAANAIKPFRTYTGAGLHGIDSRIHHPTHIIGLWGARAGAQPTSIYRRFPEPNGPSITSSAVNSTTETITSVAHGLVTGDFVIVTAAVNGLSINTLYFVIRVDADNFRLAANRTDAFAGTPFNLTGTSAMTVQKPSLRGNLALALYGGDIRYITYQASASLAGGGSGLSAILPSDTLRTGDLYIVDNYIASGAGSNFSIVIDGSANISPDPSGIGSNGMRDVRVKNNIIFGANIASALLHSPFGLDWDNSMKATITGGSGNSTMMYLVGAPDNRGYYASLKNDTPWGDVLLDYVEQSGITGRKRGALRNTANVKGFSWLGDDEDGITEQNWVDNSGFPLDRRSAFHLVGVKTTSSSEAAAGHIHAADGMWSSKMAGTGTNNHARFYNDALNTPTVVGGISSNTVTTTFATSSDATLKDDRGEMPANLALEILRLIKFHEFDWLKGNMRDYGVFAQELQKVWPAAVIVGGHYVDDVYVPWQVDYSKLVVPLGRALQAMLDRQDAFEARLMALERA